MRTSLLLIPLVVACTAPTSDTDPPETDPVDTEDTDVVEPSPWTELASLPGAGAWPAVGVLGTVIHVVPSNSTTHHVYDTATDGGWQTAAPLPEAAYYHTGAAADGRFFVIGGGSPRAIDSVDWNYVWDPEGDSWSLAAPMPTPRGYVNSAVVDGEIFAIGGPNVSGQTWNRTVEAYDPVADTWRSGELAPSLTMWPLYSALGVVDDQIVKLGGGISTRPFDSAFVYDVSDDAWTPRTLLPVENHGPAGTALGRSVYVIGGYIDDDVSDQVWRYDVDADSYEQQPRFPLPLAYSKAVTVGACLYLIGGHDNANEAASDTFAKWCPEG